MATVPVTSPKTLAQWLAQLPEFANSTRWGIGGSCLLQQLGLVTHCRDLDIVTTEAEFPKLAACLQRHLAAQVVAPHPLFCSRFFAAFRHPSGVVVELMAGIAVVKNQHTHHWQFDPNLLVVKEQLPWMQASQWLALYQLFDRPASVALLKHHLALSANTLD